MASFSSMKVPVIIFFLGSLFFQATLAEVTCENLTKNKCSFAIASSGKRCMLEKYRNEEGNLDYACKTSEVVVERLESIKCVGGCGVNRGFPGTPPP